MVFDLPSVSTRLPESKSFKDGIFTPEVFVDQTFPMPPAVMRIFPSVVRERVAFRAVIGDWRLATQTIWRMGIL